MQFYRLLGFGYLSFFLFFQQILSSTYYLDHQGSDSNDGSESDPWGTLEYSAAQLQPGDSLLVRGGLYNEIDIVINSQGTEDARVVIKNYPGERPVFDGSLEEFRSFPNSNWESENSYGDINLYKSVNTFPNFDQAHAYLWLDDTGEKHMKLIPYETNEDTPLNDAWRHIIAENELYSQTEGFYCGPGAYWNQTDEKIYVRLQHSGVQTSMGYNIPNNLDPRQNRLYVFNDRSIVIFDEDAAFIDFEGIHIRHQNLGIEFLTGPSHDIRVRNLSILGGRYHILVRSGSYNLEIDNVTCIDSVPPWVTWHDVKDGNSGRPVHLFQMAFANFGNGTHDIIVKNCDVRNVFDVVDALHHVYNLHMFDNYFEGIRDDVLQLGTTSYNVYVHDNWVDGQAAGPARNGYMLNGSPHSLVPGTKFIYRNVFDNRRLDLMYREGFPEYNAENLGFVNRAVFGSHGVEAGTVDPWKIYHNTVLVGPIRNNNWSRIGIGFKYTLGVDPMGVKQEVYNNVFIQTGDGFFEYKLDTDTDAQILDGNLYFRTWAAAGNLTQPFFAYVYKDARGEAKHFDSLGEFKNDTEGFYAGTIAGYAPGWENSGIEANPQFFDFENFVPKPDGPAATLGIDLTEKNWPGTAQPMNFRGAIPPRDEMDNNDDDDDNDNDNNDDNDNDDSATGARKWVFAVVGISAGVLIFVLLVTLVAILVVVIFIIVRRKREKYAKNEKEHELTEF